MILSSSTSCPIPTIGRVVPTTQLTGYLNLRYAPKNVSRLARTDSGSLLLKSPKQESIMVY
jgi:hypothetical protein